MTKTLAPPTLPTLKNAAAAPMLYFDGAPFLGAVNGIIEIELAARILVPKGNGEVVPDVVCVAHLRCSVAAAESLFEALDKALTMSGAQRASGYNGERAETPLKQ